MPEPETQIQDFKLFLPITKVDEVKREVYGFGVVEMVDKANPPEIFDYASSKPNILKVAEETRQRTKGKSLFPIREMHGPKAAGKVVSLQADDTHKGFYVGAKIVDDSSWEKVQEGVLTGFSIGGHYANRWWDANKSAYRYTADPLEFSLVDVPCVPGSAFDMVKSDGTIEKRAFQNVAPDATPPPPIPTPPLTVAPVFDSKPFLQGLYELGERLTKFAMGYPTPSKEVVAEHGDQPSDLAKEFPDFVAQAVDSVPQATITRPAETEVVQQTETQYHPVVFNPLTGGNEKTIQGAVPPSTDEMLGARPPLIPASVNDTLGKLEAQLDEARTQYELAKEQDAHWEKIIGIASKPFVLIDLGKAAIPAKEGEPKTPPKGYPTERAQYADPTNFSWPCDTKARCLAAVRYYNGGKGKDKYKDREWAILGRRIARMASGKTGATYKFDPRTKQIERAEKKPNGGKENV